MESTDAMNSTVSRADKIFFAIGLLVSTVFILKLLHGTFSLIRLYLWPRIASKKDFVAMYGKWAVITGGSDGIGKAYAMELAHRGVNIFVISNFENNIVSEIKKKYDVEVKFIHVDFASPDVFEQIEKELSLIDDIGILINNVGMANAKWQPIVEQKRNFLTTIMNVNMTAMVLMTELILKRMVSKNKGLIVNMSSLSSQVPLPYGALYCSSKAFVENYSVSLAAELNETNIQVKCLEPSFVRTNILKGMSSLVEFLSGSLLLKASFPDASTFAASAVPTFAIKTPVIYSGFWTQEIVTALIPSSIGKEHIATIMKAAVQYISGGEV